MGPARGHRPSRGGEQQASKLGKAEAAFLVAPRDDVFFSTEEISTRVGKANLRAENFRLLLDALGSKVPTDFSKPPPFLPLSPLRDERGELGLRGCAYVRPLGNSCFIALAFGNPPVSHTNTLAREVALSFVW